jgi:hypothetical protein
VLKAERAREKSQVSASKGCPSDEGADAAHMPAIRKGEAEAFSRSPDYKHLLTLYRVSMTPTQIGKVYTELFEPGDGISSKNVKRVLVKVHRAGFQGGARTESKRHVVH